MHFPEQNFSYVDLNLPKFVFKGPINDMAALVQAAKQVPTYYLNQGWSSLLTQICAIGTQWVKLSFQAKTYHPRVQYFDSWILHPI